MTDPGSCANISAGEMDFEVTAEDVNGDRTFEVDRLRSFFSKGDKEGG